MHEIKMIMYDNVWINLFFLMSIISIISIIKNLWVSNNVLNEMEYFVDQ